MDQKVQTDNSIINFNNLILEEVQSYIKDFLKNSLYVIQKKSLNNNIYFKLLFYNCWSKYINLDFVYKFPGIKSDNIFYRLYICFIELFDMMLKINITEDDSDHLKLIILLNYIRRLIYEKKSTGYQTVDIVLKMPCSLKKEENKISLKKYGSCNGIINLLEKLEWIIIDNKDGIQFKIDKSITEKINCDKGFIISLEKLLFKLNEIYNNVIKLEDLLIEIFPLNDYRLADILETSVTSEYLMAWKKCLGFDRWKRVDETRKMELLRSNYEYFISNYGEKCDDANDINKKVIKIHGSQKVIFQGII